MGMFRARTFGALKKFLLGSTSIAIATLAVSATAAAANRAPTISGTPKTSIAAGSTYRFTPTAKDADGDQLNFVVLNLPSWANFSWGAGSISGKPTKAGTWSNIQIFVNDGTVQTALKPFSITVTGSVANRAPTISGTPAASATVGTAYSFRPTAADADRNALGFSISNKPSWASFSTSSGQLSGTPGSGNVGTFSNIVIGVSDGKVTTRLPAFAITVKAATSTNSAPKISGTPTTSIKAGGGYSFTPTASDANGDTLTFSITNKPSWAAFSTTSGRLSGTPTAAQVGTYSNITIKVSDGKTSASLAAFGINVTAIANGAATVQWTPPTRNTDGSTLANLSGYRIYYGTNSGALNQTIRITNASVSTYVVDNLSPATWYFAVKAVNSAGAESSLSNITSKRIN